MNLRVTWSKMGRSQGRGGRVADWAVELSEVGFGHAGRSGWLFSGLNLDINPESRVAIVGPSGSGKTSLIRIVAGIVRPDQGSVVRSGSIAKVGLLPQDDVALPWRSVWRNLELVRDGRLKAAALESILSAVGLPRAEFGNRLPSELSGGERRRLGLAMVLAAMPDLVLLDEAGSSLDEQTRFRMVDEIILALERRPAGLVVITHDLEEALLLATQILVLDGRGGIAHRSVDLPKRRTSDLRFTAHFQSQRAELVRSIRG